jgi:hypothetical protein
VPGRPNEDFVIATTDIVVVDGAYPPAAATTALPGTPGNSASTPWPREALATGITTAAGLHDDTRHLTDPGTPCAAIDTLRVGTCKLEGAGGNVKQTLRAFSLGSASSHGEVG